MTEFPQIAFENRSNQSGEPLPWTIEQLHDLLEQEGTETTKRTVERSVLSRNMLPQPLTLETVRDEHGRPVKHYAGEHLLGHARHNRNVSLFVQMHTTPSGTTLIAANDGRSARRWNRLPTGCAPGPSALHPLLPWALMPARLPGPPRVLRG